MNTQKVRDAVALMRGEGPFDVGQVLALLDDALAQQPAKPVMWIGKLDFEALQSRGRVTLTAYSEPVGSASNEVALCVQQPTAQQPAPKVSESRPVLYSDDYGKTAAPQQPAPQPEGAPAAWKYATRKLLNDMSAIAERTTPRGLPIAEFAMHAIADFDAARHGLEQTAPQPVTGDDLELRLGPPAYHNGLGRLPDLWNIDQIRRAFEAGQHPAPQPRRDFCPEKLKPGGCQLHNLHCGFPKCNERPEGIGEQP